MLKTVLCLDKPMASIYYLREIQIDNSHQEEQY